MEGKNNMEILFRSSILCNFEQWKVFHEDAQIVISFNSMKEFSQY
jgi:hypothetical protein